MILKSVYGLVKEKANLDLDYFVKSGFWVSVKNLVGMFSGFLLGVVFARMISKEVYGQYLFIFSVMYMFNFLSIPKFDFALSQSVARGKDGALFQCAKFSFGGSLIISIILAVIGARYLTLGDPLLGKGFLVAAVFFPFVFGIRVYDFFLQGKKFFNRSALFSAFTSLVTALLMIMAMILGGNLIHILLVYFFVNSVLNIIFFWNTTKLMSNQKTDPSVVRYGIYLTFLALLGIIVTRLGSVMLSHYKGAEILAIYSVAIVIPKAIQDLMQNYIDVAKIKVANRNHDELVRVVKKHSWKWIIGSFLIVLLLWIFLPLLIPFIYSNNYNDAIHYGQVASLSLLFFPINTFWGNLVLLEKKHKLIALSHFIPSMPNLILIPLAVSLFGAWGIVGVNLFSWLYLTPFNLWAVLRKQDL